MGNFQTIRQLDAGKEQCIVAYGTSLTEGGVWVDILRTQLQDRYPGLANVINSAKSAMWSQWGIENLSERVLAHKPDMAFIEFAMNDAYLPYETSLDQCRSRLEFMIDKILEINASCDIILMTMNPPVGEHLEKRPHILEYYQVYRSVAEERNLTLIDHFAEWNAISKEDRERFDRLVPDGIHPSPEGDKEVTVRGIERVLFN
ncbi:SGNH/GDSL hydrolase family protein [Paenibacillus montanisoli]|uniref:SGNH/GDSL hydrolase family protein n=1 Tax=Paenibacillus montanisoli TaxID=2081970 RepID=A0A328TT83_9BACL|nr:SGNH/GDSL hydrolase family protein [Paenibacillus montanisoli]RAP73748.1 SGNH/GDSL hydrolase family protein [Paenibacillus montanisoli]